MYEWTGPALIRNGREETNCDVAASDKIRASVFADDPIQHPSDESNDCTKSTQTRSASTEVGNVLQHLPVTIS